MSLKIHTPKTLCKYGFKQWTTWFGILLFVGAFIYIFKNDLYFMIKEIIRDPKLKDMLIPAVASGAMILFNRFKDDDKNDE